MFQLQRGASCATKCSVRINSDTYIILHNILNYKKFHCLLFIVTNNTQAGIKGLSHYGQGSNIKEKKHFSYTGTKKAFPSILTSTSTTIPLKRIFGRILRDLQNLPQNTVPNGYHSPSLLSPYSTSEHCKSKIYITYENLYILLFAMVSIILHRSAN